MYADTASLCCFTPRIHAYIYAQTATMHQFMPHVRLDTARPPWPAHRVPICTRPHLPTSPWLLTTSPSSLVPKSPNLPTVPRPQISPHPSIPKSKLRHPSSQNPPPLPIHTSPCPSPSILRRSVLHPSTLHLHPPPVLVVAPAHPRPMPRQPSIPHIKSKHGPGSQACRRRSCKVCQVMLRRPSRPRNAPRKSSAAKHDKKKTPSKKKKKKSWVS